MLTSYLAYLEALSADYDSTARARKIVDDILENRQRKLARAKSGGLFAGSVQRAEKALAIEQEAASKLRVGAQATEYRALLKTERIRAKDPLSWTAGDADRALAALRTGALKPAGGPLGTLGALETLKPLRGQSKIANQLLVAAGFADSVASDQLQQSDHHIDSLHEEAVAELERFKRQRGQHPDKRKTETELDRRVERATQIKKAAAKAKDRAGDDSDTLDIVGQWERDELAKLRDGEEE
jgi:hypothetical protein